MYDALALLLTPITWPMGVLLGLYTSLFQSAGLGIIALSTTFSLAMLPLSWRAQAAERRASAKAAHVRRELAARRGTLKGEALFDLTEQIYGENDFHPIQTVMTGAGLIVMLPVLISSIIVIDGSRIEGASFLLIGNLAQPDHLLEIGTFSLNLLPLLMFGISLLDAVLRYRGSPADVLKFLLISFFLLFLVYDLASGLVLYWVTSNLFALVLANFFGPKREANGLGFGQGAQP